jgi:hypothetical protein
VTRLVALCFGALLLLLGACGGDGGGSRSVDSGTGEPAPEGIDGVLAYGVTDNSHVEGAIDYDVSPPVGGLHNPVWANCGFYDGEIPNENAVHSLEHGAVWITYTADADAATLEALQAIAAANGYVLVSRNDGQDSPLVLTAWNRQLAVDAVDDPRVEEFVATYVGADTAPEPGGLCSGGAG